LTTDLSLAADTYANPTALGVFYATCTDQAEPGRALLMNLICEAFKMPLDREALLSWAGCDDLDQGLQILYRLQRLDFVRGSSQPGTSPDEGNLETLLPPLLEQLSHSGSALLADSEGLYIASAGFTHEVAEQLAAMAVDFSLIQARYRKTLRSKLQDGHSGVALVSGDGRADLGFWPLYIGRRVFFLAIEGVPQFNQLAFTKLVQLLAIRYRRMGREEGGHNATRDITDHPE
jgi:hypothetical protein